MTVKTWSDIITEWKDVEMARDRVDNPISSGYQIKLQTITGLLQMNALDVHNSQYQARVSMFDVLYHRFVGRTWHSKMVDVSQDQRSIELNQIAYFHTPVLDSNVVFAIEIVARQTPKNPLPNDKSFVKHRSLGWTILRPFTVGSQIKDVADGDPPAKKLDVFQGSPRALHFMEDPLEVNPALKHVPGCQMTLTLCRHSALTPAIHLMPENVLFGADQRVPGLSESFSKTKQGRDYYLKPRLLKVHVGYIDKLSVNLGSTIEKFEEELCRKANEDRLLKNNITHDGKNVAVAERRLMIGVHNGHCYVQKPQYAHLEPEAVVGRSRTASFGRGKRKEVSSVSLSSSNRLLLRSRIQLNEMIVDPLVAIVMQLEYVLSIPTNEQRVITGSMSSLRTQPVTVMVRWAFWSPYAADGIPEQISIKLKGGSTENPDRLLFFQDRGCEEDCSKVDGVVKFSYLTTDLPPPAAVAPPPDDEASTLTATRTRTPAKSTQKDESEEEYKIEISHMDTPGDAYPVYAPPIRAIAQNAPSLSRAAYARLFEAGFPEIFDRSGVPADVVDTTDPMLKVNVKRETSDVLQANEIILQFLAFTTPVPTNPSEAPPTNIHSLFFSFQFYRFRGITTQRMSLVRSRDVPGLSNLHNPRVLRKIESGGELGEGKPGLEVKYHVDPAHMKCGENSAFLSYLATHNLHIDVWDGDSLLLLGSLSVPLKFLLRGGRSAVCSNHELDVVFSEHSEAAPTMTGDLTAGGSVRPLGLSKTFRGKLHLRLGNVGFPSECKSLSAASLKKSHLVIADMSGSGFPGGSLSSVEQSCRVKSPCRPRKARPKRLVDTNQELADLLLISATRDKSAKDVSENENLSKIDIEADAERKRKLARMKAVRLEEQTETKNAKVVKTVTTGQRALAYVLEKRKHMKIDMLRRCIPAEVLESISAIDRNGLRNIVCILNATHSRFVLMDATYHQLSTQERSMKFRDLKTVSNYREQLKNDHITEILLLSITTHHTIRPTLGVAEFVELQLKNPYTTQQTVTIDCESDELRVITDAREWRYFKALANVHTPSEENMFHFSPATSLPQILLRPKETIFIPFCYQGYEANHQVTTQNPSQFFKSTTTSLQPTKEERHYGTIKSKVVKSVLRTTDGRPLSLLQLSVEPQPHVVDQTFRFYNPEHTFLKKCIRLPPFRPDSDNQFHVVCSDPDVVCQTRKVNRDEPHEIFIKAPCGESPAIRRFYVSIYNDPFLAAPVQIWQFYVHALQRVDVNCVLGQTSRFSLVLRGTKAARMVRCFSSHPLEMQVVPDEAFLLPANSVHEINAGVRTTSTVASSRYMYINVVDTEYHQLIRTWLVAIKTREPMITKEFDIELPRSGGKGCNKMISYCNPYPNRKVFYLMSSRSDLLQFRENRLELSPGAQTTIGLRFTSGVAHSGKFPVHIFINDEDDKNEETFLVNVTYV